MKALSLKTYLIRLVRVCVLPLLLLALYLAYLHVDTLLSQRDREATDRVQDISTAIDSRIAAQIAALRMLSASTHLDDPSLLNEFYKEARSFRENLGGHVVLADLTTQMLLNTRVPFGTILPKLPRPKGHAAVPVVLATGKPAVGDIFPGPLANESLVAVVVPVIRDGETRFLLLSTIEIRQFQRLIDELTLPPGCSLALLDGTSAALARRGSAIGDARGGDERSGRFIANSAVSPWSVVLEIPGSVRRAQYVTAVAALALAVLAVTFISMLIGGQAARRLVQSVATLTDSSSPPPARLAITEVERIRGALAEAVAVREREAETVREQDRFIRAIMDTSPALIYIYDSTTQGTVYANAGIERLLGYSATELGEMGKQLFGRLIHPDDLPRVIEFQSRIPAAGDRDVLEIEYRMRRFDGTWCALRSYESPFKRSPAGSLQQKIGVAIDITERKSAEASLIEKENRFRDLVENSNDLICTHDLDGVILSANPAAVKALGYPADELLGMNLRDILTPEKRGLLPVYLKRLRRRGSARGLMYVRTATKLSFMIRGA